VVVMIGVGIVFPSPFVELQPSEMLPMSGP